MDCGSENPWGGNKERGAFATQQTTAEFTTSAMSWCSAGLLHWQCDAAANPAAQQPAVQQKRRTCVCIWKPSMPAKGRRRSITSHRQTPKLYTCGTEQQRHNTCVVSGAAAKVPPTRLLHVLKPPIGQLPPLNVAAA
jgi:hypothetical protein